MSKYTTLADEAERRRQGIRPDGANQLAQFLQQLEDKELEVAPWAA